MAHDLTTCSSLLSLCLIALPAVAGGGCARPGADVAPQGGPVEAHDDTASAGPSGARFSLTFHTEQAPHFTTTRQFEAAHRPRGWMVRTVQAQLTVTHVTEADGASRPQAPTRWCSHWEAASSAAVPLLAARREGADETALLSQLRVDLLDDAGASTGLAAIPSGEAQVAACAETP